LSALPAECKKGQPPGERKDGKWLHVFSGTDYLEEQPPTHFSHAFSRRDRRRVILSGRALGRRENLFVIFCSPSVVFSELLDVCAAFVV
jgi:hypothetical protein